VSAKQFVSDAREFLNIAIPLSASLLKVLSSHRVKQAQARLKLGAAWTNLDLVFCSEVGKPDSRRPAAEVLRRYAGGQRASYSAILLSPQLA
jgi:hypothetical protein